MRIKDEISQSPFLTKAGKLFNFLFSRKSLRFISLVWFWMCAAGLIVFLTVYFTIQPEFKISSSGIQITGTKGHNSALDKVIQPAIKQNIKIPVNYIKGKLFGTAKTINIDIPFKEYQKLLAKREEAIKQDVLVTGSDDMVKASVRYNDQSHKAKLRLKGDFIGHLLGDKWSFRVQLKKGKTLFGFNKFSLHHPQQRSYLWEWLYHKMLKDEDVLSLRYEFINVIVNGKHLGIYAIEEHFDKHLVEYNNRREGPILKLSESMVWDEYLRQEHPFKEADVVQLNDVNDLQLPAIEAFKEKKTLSKDKLKMDFLQAKNLLEGFRRGIFRTSEVFDVDKLADYFAITDFLHVEHGSHWHNIRFYYNPVTALVEPIGFDGDADIFLYGVLGTRKKLLSNDEIASGTNLSFYDLLFSDKVFFEKYMTSLEKVSNPEYVDKFMAAHGKEIKKNITILHSEFPFVDFKKDYLYQFQDYIRSVILPSRALNAHLDIVGEKKLQVGNIHPLPVKVIGYGKEDNITSIKGVVLQPRLRGKPLHYTEIPISNAEEEEMIVKYQVLGTSEVYTEKVLQWPYFTKNVIKKHFQNKIATLKKHPCVVVNEAKNEISIKPGRWTLKEDLVVPAGYRFFMSENTTLDLNNKATLISFSPVNIVGTQENPVKIISSDGTGQGVAVMQAKKLSTLKYVEFDNLSFPNKKGWGLTGSVTFYESPVNISHTQMIKNHAEDFLNIIRSQFKLSKSVLHSSNSDAVDIDFGKGEISEFKCLSSGNDCLDFSGSKITINNVSVTKAKDKAVSVGENSKVNASNVSVKDSHIGLVAKDSSQFKASKINLNNLSVGFAVYQKKNEFGPANLDATEVKYDKLVRSYMLEKRSKLSINQNTQNEFKKNVYSKILKLNDEDQTTK